ncbi:MAG TPA: substrate-binding domain-containing protein [Roseiflexaceae bacterium]|nr:substrate-binding domain-containing protein [Roseiflexaceae bacterium]
MASKLSRRTFLRTAAALGGMGLLAACGGAAQPQQPAGGEQPAATQPPAQGGQAVTEITFWWWDAAGQIWADEYAKVNPQIKVTFVNTPFADAHDKLLTSFAAGSGAPDVASIEIGRVGSFTAKGGLVDLKAPPFDAGQFEKDMVAYKWTQGSTEDGRLVCFPWDIGPAGVWYRTDIFEALGLPVEPEKVEELISHTHGKKWEDFFALAKQIKDKSGDKTKFVADAGTDIYGASYRQQGEGYQQGNKILIEEKATRPFQLASDFRKQGLDANIPWWGAEWQTGLKEDAFAGMVIAAWMQGGLTRDQPDLVGKWRVVRAPEANYNWGGSFVAIPEQSKNKEAAWEFIKWACASAEGQNVLFKQSGVFPAYKPAWQDPLYDAPVEFFGGQRTYRIWTEIADNIPAILRTPNDLQLDDIVGAELTKVLQEGKDPVQAAKDAEAEALKRIEGVTA